MADVNFDGVLKLQAITSMLGELIRAFKTAFPTKWSIGTFTCGAAASTVVADVNVTASSHVTLTPLNAAAANMVAGATSPYISARTVGVSFTVTTASGGAAAGTEQFSYHVVSK